MQVPGYEDATWADKPVICGQVMEHARAFGFGVPVSIPRGAITNFYADPSVLMGADAQGDVADGAGAIRLEDVGELAAGCGVQEASQLVPASESDVITPTKKRRARGSTPSSEKKTPPKTPSRKEIMLQRLGSLRGVSKGPPSPKVWKRHKKAVVEAECRTGSECECD